MSDTVGQLSDQQASTQQPASSGVQLDGNVYVQKHPDGSASYYPAKHADGGSWIPFTDHAAAAKANDMPLQKAVQAMKDTVGTGKKGQAQSMADQLSRESIASGVRKSTTPPVLGMQAGQQAGGPSMLEQTDATQPAAQPTYQFSNPRKKRRRSMLPG